MTAETIPHKPIDTAEKPSVSYSSGYSDTALSDLQQTQPTSPEVIYASGSRTIELKRLAALYGGPDVILPSDEIDRLIAEQQVEEDDFDPTTTPERRAAISTALDRNESSAEAELLLDDAIGRLAIAALELRSNAVESEPVDLQTIKLGGESVDLALAHYLETKATMAHDEALRTGYEHTQIKARSLASSALKLYEYSASTDQSESLAQRITGLSRKQKTTYADEYYANNRAKYTPASSGPIMSTQPQKVERRLQKERTGSL